MAKRQSQRSQESQQSEHQLWCVLQVLLTDLDEVTPLLEFNVALNRARGLKMDVKVGRFCRSPGHCTWMFQSQKDLESYTYHLRIV